MKIAILGDSISEGLGSKKINYVRPLFEYLEEKLPTEQIEIGNYSKTGKTIHYALDIIDDVNSFNPDVVIIMCGIVDAMIRPNPSHKPNFYWLVPKRYRGNGMLHPRPFYSVY